MSFYIWSAGLALALKVWVLLAKRNSESIDKRWILLVVCFSGLNLSELIIYINQSDDLDQSNLLSAYYACCVGALIASQLFSIRAESKTQTIVFSAFLIVGSVIAIAFLGTDILIQGHIVQSYPVKTIKGDYFHLFSWYAISSTMLTAINLVYNYRTASTEKSKASYLCAIAGMSFLVVTTFVVMAAMMLGFEANGSAWVPISTTLFLLITVRGNGEYLSECDPRKFNPLMPESKSSKRVERVMAEMSLEGLSLPEVMNKIELSIIDYQIEKSGGNKSAAARNMKISRSTLHKKIRPD